MKNEIDRLVSVNDVINLINESNANLDYCAGKEELINQVMEIASDGWIPCSISNPDRTDIYCVYLEGYYKSVFCMYDAYKKEWGMINNGEWMLFDNVMSWRERDAENI